jgi:hypothetical protein
MLSMCLLILVNPKENPGGQKSFAVLRDKSLVAVGARNEAAINEFKALMEALVESNWNTTEYSAIVLFGTRKQL